MCETIYEIADYVQTACSEAPTLHFAEDCYPTHFERARKIDPDGDVDAIAARVADMLYNDVDIVKILVGDVFYEWCFDQELADRVKGARTLVQHLGHLKAREVTDLKDYLVDVANSLRQ